MEIVEENPPVPNWLLKLEEQREKRLKTRLGHETGAGAPCQVCKDKCPGLDLHFWRKICKVCKCKKEEHDINEDDIYGFVQFQLLGSKPAKAKSFLLSGHKDEVVLDWTPKGSSNDVKKYLDELPSDMLPVKGSEAAKLRKQRLQKQMPAHDIDATLCHALTEDEVKELEEYVAHIRKHSVGQGKVIPLSLVRGQKHQIGQPNPQFLTQHVPGQVASSQTVYLHPSDLANNLQNLKLQSAKPPNRIDFLNSQLPQIDEQNPVTLSHKDINRAPSYAPKDPPYTDNQLPSKLQTKDIHAQKYQMSVPADKSIDNQNVHVHDLYPDATENVNRLIAARNYAAQNIHKIVDNQTPVAVGKVSDVSYPTDNRAYPNYVPKTNNQTSDAQNPMHYNPVDIRYADNPNYPNAPFDPMNVPYPQTENADTNKNPYDWQRAPNYLLHSPTGVAQPINYPLTTSNVEKHQEQFENPNILNANVLEGFTPFEHENRNYKTDNQYPKFDENAQAAPEYRNYQPEGSINEAGTEAPTELTNRNPVFFAENKINPIENQQSLASVGYLRDLEYPAGKGDAVLSCHKCAKVFDDDGIAISVERTESLWHPGCFTCKTCNQPLADLMYFYHKDTDDIYCGRDYALLKGIPRCAACDELIFVREYCLAEDHTFHIKHFCCFECDDPLAGKQYLMENNQPVCLPCYEKLKADKCNDCGYVISAEQRGVTLQNLHWHADESCFACKNCRKALLGQKLLLRNQNLFCSDVCFKSY